MMKKTLNPRIEMFSPFKVPFATEAVDVVGDNGIYKFVVVSSDVVEYMKDNNTKIVAKCTPCQCCACR